MSGIGMILVASAVFSTGGCKDASPAGDSSGTAAKGPVKVGDAAPALSLKLHDGTSVSLASLKGHNVLLWFYPKDGTGG